MNRPHLGAEQVAEIRRRHAAGYSITELAKAFGRGRLAIGRIVKGKTYKKVDADAVAEFTPLPKGGASAILKRLRPQDTPRVRHAPAEAPTTITHLGSAQDGPRCGATVLSRNNEYVATIEEIERLNQMGVAYCSPCAEIGLDERRRSKADLAAMPSYGGRLP